MNLYSGRTIAPKALTKEEAEKKQEELYKKADECLEKYE